ncbi:MULTISPECIES: hypothetical protein [Bizionia]|uniref:Carboxypeptidase-like regulatory domain-containing protein n=1 Tax=Bizionia algoritergicola TaxID=291187 RepID=A0A5D0R1G7_9FLAO|nr:MULTISPECIES: hypothetical protein [Bizionia]TYB74736.1 hypothetical protein ES675_00950 [Bizionia algoritergicola]
MRHQNIYLVLFILFNFLSIYAQRTLKGKIIDEDIGVFPGVRVFENDTTLIGETDLNGNFEVLVSNNINELTFTCIGCERITISLYENCDYIEFILLGEAVYHYKSSKKIDRLRKKRFDKLPNLYRQAYNNGIFKSEKPCFEQEFVLIKQELDEISRQDKIIKKEIENQFKDLAIGDTIRIPYATRFGYDGSERTTLFAWSSYTDETQFDCIIEGIIIDKNKRNRGYNLIFEIIQTNQCNHKVILFDETEMRIGQILKHNIKHTKILIK